VTTIGWLQIALFAALVGSLTSPVGGYLARVYNRERTLLQPLLGPIENAIYRVVGSSQGPSRAGKRTRFRSWPSTLSGLLSFMPCCACSHSCCLIHQSFRRPYQIWHSTLR
jgi:K+-transporting ATPase A subunit